jgi:hypothetical protein
MAAKGDYRAVVADLNAIVNSGDSGMEIWAAAVVSVTGKSIDAVISTMATAWVKAGPLTTEGLNREKAAILEAVLSIENQELVPNKRVVSITCCQHSFVVNVDGVVHQISVALNMMWRPNAVSQGNLVKLFCEDLVLPNAAPLSTIPVSRSLFEGADKARRACNSAFAEWGTLTGQQTAASMKTMRSTFEIADADFDADAQLVMAVCGDNSELRLISAMVALMPTKTAEKNIDTTLHMLVSMINENVYKLASKTAQAKHTLVKNTMVSLVSGAVPNLSVLVADKSLEPLMTKLQYFVRFETPGPSSGKPKVDVGLDAMKKIRDVCKKKHDTTADVTEQDVSRLKAFFFLVPTADEKSFKDVMAHAKKTMGSKLKVALEGKTKKVSMDKAVSEAVAMFA